MRFLLIPDKFKGSLTSAQVSQNMERGIRRIFPDATVHSLMASDGGDGFLESVGYYIDTETILVDTLDPLGRPIRADMLWDPKSSYAYIELALSSGIELLKEADRNPLQTSTEGTGIQIRKAIELGAKKVFIGLGGSATNDGGCGIARALGWKFLDKKGKPINPIGATLYRIQQIISPEIKPDCSITAVNDVTNPLFGPNGAAFIYAEQKGASSEEIAFLDEGLSHLHAICSQGMDHSLDKLPGAGAAGGTAYGLKVFMNATFVKGTTLILKLSGAEEKIRKQGYDYLFTGEGRIDLQSGQGKLISGVLQLGQKYDIPVIGFCGILDKELQGSCVLGFHSLFEIRDSTRPLAYNMDNAAFLLEKTVNQAVSKMV